ncbi:MAG: ribosome small subunit-dependent GTPase A [Flavobacteriales bacterium]|nr:ribosome small subunit-dependent GTPase A [Flavobacteriales bacterium]MBK9058720.1 ribosome small subunit-dependent GTPase A [Flavobacteriales bacterium]QQS71284.1 MAG: ribosome small subunit-dependent GTPase A [Flavobacteriales bacterium]HQV39406.1 ribosome small subunit-dependent GTPase A [Flavobacteriales bacterium]HQW32902.1 ribosome small subunit-dependent GTPase A [Flavobacteriales bacterium]
MPTGLLMRSTGSRYIVRGEDGVLHTCIAKGKLRIKGYSTTNPLAVGDLVEFNPAAEKVGNEMVGAVTELHHRRNYLVRKSVNLSHHKHVIASNMDQCLVLVTLARPRTSFGFIDRVLVTAEAYRIPPIIIFNKVDDYDDDELGLLAEYEDVYQGAGYRTLITSALKNVGMDEVKELLKGKVSLLVGHSGVGKSTLVNAIDPALDLHTLEISASTDKGQHTTTAAEMFELQLSPAVLSREPVSRESGSSLPTFIIDTPGVKGFGLVDMTQEEIVDQFPEFFALKGECRFGDCKHMKEPGCAVLEAVESGEIAGSRYNSYIDMVEGVDEATSYR